MQDDILTIDSYLKKYLHIAPKGKEFSSSQSDCTLEKLKEMRNWASRSYLSRRIIDNYFSNLASREPGWDIMLILFLAWCDEREMTTTAVYAAARTSPGTGGRVVRMFEHGGLLRRRQDTEDLRVWKLSLTQRGQMMMLNVYEKILNVDQLSVLDYI